MAIDPRRNRRGPQLPKKPVRKPVNPGALAAIKEPHERLLFQQYEARITAMDKRLTELDTFALKAGSPVDAFGQRVKNVATPVHQDDAVPLWYMRQFIETSAALARRRAGSDAEGEQNSNEFGIIGGGSLPPLVSLPNLLNDVQTYAAAHPADFANHCVTSGGSWAFMTGLIAYLQGIDPRVGGNNKRGNEGPSLDALSYWHQNLPPVVNEKNVYVVDVIVASCSAGASPGWQNVTKSGVAGAWLSTVP